jgi:tetratricopeptide (TPR) repeat protein
LIAMYITLKTKNQSTYPDALLDEFLQTLDIERENTVEHYLPRFRANDYYQSGAYLEAIEAYEATHHTQQQHTETPPAEHQYTLQCLAKSYYANQNYSEALTTIEKISTFDNNIATDTLILSGKVHAQLHHYDKAQEICQDLHAIKTQQTHDQHSAFKLMLGLADIYYITNQHNLAQDYYEQAFDLDQTYDYHDVDTAESLIALADIYTQKEMLTHAETSYQKALITLSYFHPKQFTLKLQLADFYCNEKNYTKSLEIFEALCSPYKPADEFSSTLNDLHLHFLNLYHQHQQPDLMHTVYLNACSMLQMLNDTTAHITTIRNLNALAQSYATTETQYPLAIHTHQQALTQAVQHLGHTHIETLITLAHLAKLYTTHIDHHAAKNLYQQLYSLFEQQFGEDHITTHYIKYRIERLKH